MLTTSYKHQQNLEQAMGTVFFKATTDPLFRYQVINNYETTINQLNFPLSPSEKTKLVTNVQTFIKANSKTTIEEVLDPEASPSLYWTG